MIVNTFLYIFILVYVTTVLTRFYIIYIIGKKTLGLPDFEQFKTHSKGTIIPTTKRQPNAVKYE